MTQSKRASPPGQALELEVLRLLEGAGFRALRNSRVARPRQTDILAEGNDLTLLIEAKDRKRVVDVGDVDDLRARLGRTTQDVIGIIFTTSAISGPAIKEIESDRTREILVFVAAEIELLRESKARLLNLITKKRSELRANGRVWFRTGVDGEYLHVSLPRSTMEFVAAQRTSSHFCSRTGFAHATFSMQIPDTGWGNPGSDGVQLSLSLSLSTLEELRDLFGYLHYAFGLSSSGSFTIHQSGSCWQGIGVANLLKVLTDPWSRYRAASMESMHHTEDITYFDEFQNGWLVLYTRQRVPDTPRAHSFLYDTHVCIQLPGVPVDASPYLNLCRYVGNEWADFRTVAGHPCRTRRLKKSVKLDVVGTLVRTYDDRDNDRWIVGLIARNPFYRKKRLPSELELRGELNDLMQIELIFCDLKDHIEEGDEIDQYLLKGVETMDAQYAQIIRPFGTWNKIIKRVRDREPVRQADPEASLRTIRRDLRLKRLNRRRPTSRSASRK